MSGPFGASPWGYNPSTGFYDHTIDQSLRFDAAGYLTRNTGEAGNTTVYTTSFWVKRSGLTSHQYIFSAGPWNGGNNFEGIRFVNDDTLRAILTVSNSTVANFTTNAKFRDVSAWYHIVWQRNGQAYKIYVNGTEQTYSTSTFSSNPNGYLTADTEQLISGRLDHLQDLDGYLAEFHFVDGSALDPTSFGETKDGVWISKAYSGSYGTTGFHLNFSDSSSIGADSSGLSHTFTVSGLVASDVVPDSPTNNFATANFLAGSKSSPWTTSEGNLKILSSSNNKNIRGTILMQSGKWYWETRRHNANPGSAAISDGVGIALASGNVEDNPYQSATNWSYYSNTGNKYNNNSSQSYGDSWNTAGDIIGVAFDADNGAIWFSKNGTWQNSATASEIAAGTTTNAAYTGLTDSGGYICNWWRTGGTNAEEMDINFGQNPSFNEELTGGDVGTESGDGSALFKYAPPSGFLALCSANLPDPTIGPGQDTQADGFFNMLLWTGDGNTSRAITGVGFAPDLIWIKCRSNAEDHALEDAVRGVGRKLDSASPAIEETTATAVLSAHGSDGFTLPASTPGNLNVNARTYIAWNWRAGGAPTADNSAGVGATPTAGSVKIDGSNLGSALAGSIAATRLSANTQAGFSIIKWTGNQTNSTLAHGLNSAPELVFVKSLAYSSGNWYTWTKDLTNNKVVFLNASNAETQSANAFVEGDMTATTVGLGTERVTNGSSEDMLAYVFHSVEGYSKVGSYNGNAQNYSNGTFVYTGFRPSLVAVKAESTTGDWVVTDNKRASSFNGDTARLYWSANHVETGYSSNRNVELFSNGFMVHGNSASSTTNRINQSASYVYLAFAEAPFKFANAR